MNPKLSTLEHNYQESVPASARANVQINVCALIIIHKWHDSKSSLSSLCVIHLLYGLVYVWFFFLLPLFLWNSPHPAVTPRHLFAFFLFFLFFLPFTLSLHSPSYSSLRRPWLFILARISPSESLSLAAMIAANSSLIFKQIPKTFSCLRFPFPPAIVDNSGLSPGVRKLPARHAITVNNTSIAVKMEKEINRGKWGKEGEASRPLHPLLITISQT